MKLFFTSLMILYFSLCNMKAQTVDFNNPDLANILLTIPVVDDDGDGYADRLLDTNGNGIIELPEIQNIVRLAFTTVPSALSFSGLELFPALEYLSIHDNYLYELDLSILPFLKSFTSTHTHSFFWPLPQEFPTVNFQSTSLEQLNLVYLSFPTLDLNGVPNLKEFNGRGLESLTTLNLNAAPNLEKVNIEWSFNINSVTATNLTQLQELHITSLLLNANMLDLSNSPLLRKVVIGSGAYHENLLNNLPLLEELEIWADRENTFTTTVDLSDHPLLWKVHVEGLENLTSVTFPNNNIITELKYFFTGIQNIDLSSLPLLEKFSIDQCLSVNNIDLSSNVALEQVLVKRTGISNLDLSSLPLLTDFTLEANSSFNSLDLSSNPMLEQFVLQYSNITDLELLNNNAVKELTLSNTNLVRFKLFSNAPISLVNISQNTNLEELILRNGMAEDSNATFLRNNPVLQYICVDPQDVVTYENLLPFNIGNTVINSYCSFNPGGDFNEVQGTVSIDSDNNGCDLNDPVFPQFTFGVTDGTESGSITADASGNFYIPVQDGQHTITPQPENPSYWNFSPTSITVDFPTQSSPFTQDFCVTANGSVEDLEVVVLGLEDARPGFETDYRVVVKNKGNQTVSGNLTLDYDSDYMNLLNSTPSAGASINQLDWSFTDIAPFEMLEFDFTMTLNTPTDANFPLASNDELLFTGSVTGTGNDQDLTDNTMVLNQIVVNSFDPNDKRCLEGEKITPSMVGEFVHYMIRFENTGTASAINVVIKDAIDPTMFDVSTFVPLGGSHDYYVRTVGDGNTFEFIHENINLDFNDATNDGYVLFKIKTLTTLNEGDTFSNDAEIYFDFNAPIITNDFITTVDATASIGSVEDVSIKIFPNPTTGFLNLSASSGIENVSVMDVQGRVLSNTNFVSQDQTQAIDLSQQGSGIYFLKITTDKGIAVEKVVVE